MMLYMTYITLKLYDTIWTIFWCYSVGGWWHSFEMDKELPKMVFYDMLTASLQGKKNQMRLGCNKNVLPEWLSFHWEMESCRLFIPNFGNQDGKQL